MKPRKTRRKIFIVLSSVVVLLLGVMLGILVYLKLTGLKTALQELVLVETEERYSLSVDKASVDLSALTFTFDSLKITRNPALPETGIREVSITKLKLQVANLGAMFRSKKYDIRTLIIDEPRIRIDNHKKQDTTKAKFHLGQQVVKLYPAIESILERFKIEHLKINKAALGVNNHPKPPLTLSLVDFLIEEWDETRLTEKSQLQLKIGQQELKLEKAAFSFSAIEYNLRKHQLSLDSVTFSTADSISNSHVQVYAESLVLSKLGYRDLFDNQRLTYEKVTVLNPMIDLHLILKPKISEEKQVTNEKEVLTRIIRQSVGECLVDTVAIQNAAVTTILQKGSDSTVIAVPQLNFTLYTFEITNESDSFITGTADIEFDKTSIELTDGMTISCKRLNYDQDRNLNFEDVELYDAANKLVVLDCQSLKLSDFHLLPLLFDQTLAIGSLRLENAVVKVPPGKLFASANKGKKKGLKEIDIKQVALKNVDVHQSNANMQVLATGVSINASNVKKKAESELTYTFRDLSVVDARLKLAEKNTEIHVTGIAFNGSEVSSTTAHIKQGELNIALSEVLAVHSDKIVNFKNVAIDSWQSVSAARAIIEGKLPENKTDQQSNSAKAKTSFSVAEVKIIQLQAKLSGKDLETSFIGGQLSIKNAKVEQGGFTYAHIGGILTDVKLDVPNTHVAIANIEMSLPKQVLLTNSAITREDMSFALGKARINQLEKSSAGAHWSFRKASFGGFTLTKAGQQMFRSDSILADHINFGGKAKPTVGHIEVFAPHIQLAETNEASGAAKKEKPNLAFLEQLKTIVIHPGAMVLTNKNKLVFGKTQINAPQKSFSCAYLRTEIPKFNLNLEGIEVNKTHIAIETFNLKPSAHWLKTYPYEAAVLHTNMFNTKITGYNLDSLLLSGKFHHADVSVGSYYIHARRDHTLPDAPYAEKPFSLSAMLKLPPSIKINALKLANGKIDVEQVSDKTGKTGTIDLTDVWANATLKYMEDGAIKVDLVGGALLCGQGKVDLTYTTYNADIFILQARLTDFDLTKLNPIVLPLQAIEIKSGYLQQYDYTITANNVQAVGDATITYKNLHLTIYKRGIPEEKNLGSELLTLVADGLVLKNSKKNAPSVILQQRDKEKTTFQYWVATAIQGALNGIRQGKSKK